MLGTVTATRCAPVEAALDALAAGLTTGTVVTVLANGAATPATQNPVHRTGAKAGVGASLSGRAVAATTSAAVRTAGPSLAGWRAQFRLNNAVPRDNLQYIGLPGRPGDGLLDTGRGRKNRDHSQHSCNPPHGSSST